jgi:YidC/Oxa1 family membrane protein insertase
METLVRFFFWIMSWCHAWWPNWWGDIVVFTLITKVLQFPLSLWCHVNSLKMVAVMPETLRIKMERYGDSDAIGEETARLFKREKYHPLLTLLPLGIQIVILMGFVKVIYALADAEKGGLLGRIPVQDGGIAWLMPVIAGATAFLLGFCQNRINPLQREQSRAQQMATNGISVAISLVLACFVAMGVGFYWAASNLLSILVQIACNIAIVPKSRIDYPKLREAQAAYARLENSLKRETTPEDRRREKADWKRFFSVANKHLVFYAEGGGYYKYFESVIAWLLEHSNVTIHYVTNDPRDAVFELARSRPRIRPYYIGPVRIIPLMMKMDADMVVMTTPDLETFHIKRSYVRKDVEYIHLDHGATSHHMAYRKGALDHFDTVFANGPFHIAEDRATEKLYGLKAKNLVETGYLLLDTLLATPPPAIDPAAPRIMIAPSYQQDNIFDSCLDQLVEAVAAPGRTIVLRPHPQYVRRFPARMHAIEAKYAGRPDVEIEADFGKPPTMDRSSVLVTDWSCIAYEYAFQTKRPVLFVDTPMKVINPEWERIGIVPTDISFRNRVGISLAPADIPAKAGAAVADMLANPGTFAGRIEELLREQFYNPGHAGEAAGRYILQSLIARQKKGK